MASLQDFPKLQATLSSTALHPGSGVGQSMTLNPDLVTCKPCDIRGPRLSGGLPYDIGMRRHTALPVTSAFTVVPWFAQL